ncbi:MAG TPA: hypothetical protein VGL57_12750 [Solirubrobacteraceae bacterium]|jgi:hypothetical protein
MTRRTFKPFNAVATLGAAGHNAFERWAGVGVFLEPWIGRRATNVLWTLTLPVGFERALRGGERDAPLLAFNAGIAIAGMLVHFVDWPWSLRWGVVPWLDEAEGLAPAQLPAYNTILWAWLAGGVGSVVLETRREHLKYAFMGIATGPLLLESARHHFAWAKREARRDPARWSSVLIADDGLDVV